MITYRQKHTHTHRDTHKQALYSIIKQFYLERFVEIDNIPVFSTN